MREGIKAKESAKQVFAGELGRRLKAAELGLEESNLGDALNAAMDVVVLKFDPANDVAPSETIREQFLKLLEDNQATRAAA